jgi:hypothetical protein
MWLRARAVEEIRWAPLYAIRAGLLGVNIKAPEILISAEKA